MSSENYEEEAEACRRASDAAEAERRKAEVGMAPYGSDEYCRNAAYILRAYKQPNSRTSEIIEELKRRGY
jgi:hypothetical protein